MQKYLKNKCTLIFHGTHISDITCYIKFKLLYEFKIVAFFFLSKYNIGKITLYYSKLYLILHFAPQTFRIHFLHFKI